MDTSISFNKINDSSKLEYSTNRSSTFTANSNSKTWYTEDSLS